MGACVPGAWAEARRGQLGAAAFSASSFQAGRWLAVLLSDAWPRENSHDQLTLED